MRDDLGHAGAVESVPVALRFEHGVASGDPSATSIALWTRVTPSDGARDARHELHWTVATDPELTSVIASGAVTSSPDDDHTVHVVVDGLPSGTRLWYGFSTAEGTRSPVGRATTLPAAGVHLDGFRIAVVCCARFGTGWFAAYRTAADAEPDLIVHLGDHIYEDGGACVPGREHDPPHEAITLDDYRRRHAQTCADADAQALRAAAPSVVLWDDHEFADNAWIAGAAAHDLRHDGPWYERVTAARQAWHEWMPFTHRTTGSQGLLIGHGELDRRLRIGDLVDLVLVDTRMSGRDTPADRSGAPVLVPTDDRTLLSDAQRSWLREVLTDRGARWRILANQVHVGKMHLLSVPGLSRFGPLRPIVNPDQWDGYPRERELLLELVRESGVGGMLALSGDLHATFVRTVDDEAGPVLPEITTPSTMSTPFGRHAADRTKGLLRPALLERLLRRQNRGIEFLDTLRRGCTVLDIGPDTIEVTIHLGVDTDRPEALRWTIDHDDPVPRRRYPVRPSAPAVDT